MNALYKTPKTLNITLTCKTLVSAICLLAVSAFPIASMASNADDIQQRVKKIGKLNFGEAAAPAAAPAADTSSATPAADSSDSAAPAQANGADLYQATCFACHGTGVAGAPILGKTDIWAPRIAQGEATLLDHAINGFNAMPPRGGTTLSDDEISAAVSYMIENSQ